MGIDELLREKRSQIIETAAKHGAFNIRVFGSVARGEATEESDIDFLIDYDSTRRSSWFPIGLIHDLEKLLGRKVDIATVEGLRERIRERVLREAIPL